MGIGRTSVVSFKPNTTLLRMPSQPNTFKGAVMTKEPKKKTREPAKSTGTMTKDDTPIGMLPDGTLNVIDPSAPRWKPKVLDADGNEVDPDTIEAGP